MAQFWEVCLDSLIDTAKILPFLFIVYYLIELLEFKCATKIQNNKLLKGKFSPMFGACVGCVPQCGFSVVSADLFTKRTISVGALIAVFIATSDEALPLMISEPKSIKWLLLLIGVKIVFAILIGYLAIMLHKLIFKNQKQYINIAPEKDNKHEEHQHEECIDNVNLVEETAGDNTSGETPIHAHGGCCHHKVETKSFDWLHPLTHSLKIALFVLAINFVFGIITHIWVGEDNLKIFLLEHKNIQPILALIVGLIPNCASSVVLTELFLMGNLTFGALTAGLCVNAGLGIIILLKQNKNVKENVFIILMLTIPSLILGYILNFLI